jgi:hypothetical protein
MGPEILKKRGRLDMAGFVGDNVNNRLLTQTHLLAAL